MKHDKTLLRYGPTGHRRVQAREAARGGTAHR